MDQKGQKPGKDMSLIFLKLSGGKTAYKLFPSFSFIFYSIILLFSLMTVLHCMSCFSYSYGHCSATSSSSLDPFTLLIVLLWLPCYKFFHYIFSPSHQVNWTAFFCCFSESHIPSFSSHVSCTPPSQQLPSGAGNGVCKSSLKFCFQIL